MTIEQTLTGVLGRDFSIVRDEDSALQLYAPFFHEDGDMYSIYIDETEDGAVVIRDFGNTLMRVSYTFEIDTDNKRNILERIASSNNAILEDGELMIRSTLSTLPADVLRFSQVIAKVSNVKILRREIVRSMFLEEFGTFVADELKEYKIQPKYAPTDDPDLFVDFAIPSKRSLYVFGVDSDIKAQKVIISCLNFQKMNLSFRSIIVHKQFDDLAKFSRNQITNIADKQYTSLDEFMRSGKEYLNRELLV